MQQAIINGMANQTEVTRVFAGYNHTPMTADGEFYEMENMTADHYPLLSPRKKRNLQLSVASNTWESVSLTITSSYEGDISEMFGIYTSNKFTVKQDTVFRLTYVFDISVYDAPPKHKYRFYDAAGTIIKEVETGISVKIPKGTAEMDFIVTAKALDPNTFDPDDLDIYMNSFSGEYRNDVIRGILCKGGKLAYLIKQTLYYDGFTYDMSAYMTGDDGESEQQLLSYGSYILIFPAGAYINSVTTTDKGALGRKNEINGTVTYTLCDKAGTAYNPTVSPTEPATPSVGDYWLDTGSSAPGLYVYTSLNMWEAVLTTYIKIAINGIGLGFKPGDAVFMNTKLADVNNGSILQAVNTNYIIVTAIMDKATDTETFTGTNKFYIERRIPKLDYVCVNDNRVWGCYTGEENGSIVNEIHACKLGDPKNWYCYEGIASDSYTISIASDDVFTGAVSFQGYPTFFKENVVYRIYGSYPAQYQLITYDCRGCQEGSAKSIAVVGEYLIYKSIKDFVVFDGSNPTSISENLGEEMYTEAVAGSSLMKYYVSMIDESGKSQLFIFDLQKRIWVREDNLRIEEFTYNNSGQLYGRSGTKIYGFGYAVEHLGLTADSDEDHVYWSAETGNIYPTQVSKGTRYMISKNMRPVRITIRAKIPYKSELNLEISYDDGDWKMMETLRGEEKVELQTFTVTPNRCDHYRIRLSGRDDCIVYSIARDYEIGSEW